MKKKKLLLLSLLTISTMVVSATVYAENEDITDLVIESTNEQIEKVTEENNKEVMSSSDLAEDVKEEDTKDAKDTGNRSIPESEIIKNDDSGIPDKALYDLILKAVWNDSDGILTKEEAKSVDWLITNYDDSVSIKNLKGIEYCVNLEKLFLNNEGNKITDISPISSLVNLTELTLRDIQISDITAIGNLVNLSTLRFYHTQISDITPISNLTNLENLQLDNNQISDISPVAGLTNLTSLTLTGNRISNIAPVANLTNLTVLALTDNQISDISAVANLTNLLSLDLAGNQITSIDSVINLTKLTMLRLADNKIAALPDLTKLTDLSDGRLVIEGVTQWWSVSFWGNSITLSDARKNLPNCLTSSPEWMERQGFIEDTAKEQLSEEIKSIESQNYDSSKYTTDSWNTFSSALSNARTVLAKETTNEEYKKAYEDLKSARANLRLRETPVSDGNTSKTDTNISNTNQTSGAPKTGDNAQGIIFVILALSSMGIIFSYLRKELTNKVL